MKTQFVIEQSEAESMAKSLNLPSISHLLPHLVHSAQSLARPPISAFHVGAVGLGSDGRIFIGVNVEFPNVPLHHSIHAEQFLLTNLAANDCPNLLQFAVSAAPCGHCRQFLQELRHSSSLQILITDENVGFRPLSEFLPNPFGPHDLLDRDHPLLLEKHDNGLELVNDEDEHLELSDEVEELRNAALGAANGAHAPYSGCASGVALMDCEGRVFRGSYVESAAYNPSLGPVQAALVAYVAGGGGGYERIVKAVLVEKEGAEVKQEDTARLLLKAISPKCELRVFSCCSTGNGYKKVSA